MARVVLNDLPIEESLFLALLRQEFTAQNLLIASGLNFCLAHDDHQIQEQTVTQAEKALIVAEALNSSESKKFLRGDIAFSDFGSPWSYENKIMPSVTFKLATIREIQNFYYLGQMPLII